MFEENRVYERLYPHHVPFEEHIGWNYWPHQKPYDMTLVNRFGWSEFYLIHQTITDQLQDEQDIRFRH